jgi:excisionase family DNA binding protein
VPRVFKRIITQHWLPGDWFGPTGQPCAAGSPGSVYRDRRRVPAGTPGAVKEHFKTAKYYGRVPGKREPVPLCANKAASETMLYDMIGRSGLKARGIDTSHEEHGRRPLLDHLDDYRSAMEAKGDDPRHVEETCRLVRRFLGAVKAPLPGDLDLSVAQTWLAELRDDKGVSTDPGEPDRPAVEGLPAGYSVSRVAELLGVKPDSVSPLLKRRHLPAAGNGKARRLPRQTVEALLADRTRGCSPETVNHYVRAVRSFLRWLVKNRRLSRNPLDGLEVVRADADRRRLRRELTVEELGRLLAAARASREAFRGLDGEARFHLYALAAGTGFRAGGLDSLTPECFGLEGRFPVVVLPVRGDKSKKGKMQPLPADVADLLRSWLDGKPEGKPLWPGTWASARRAAEMLRRDLAAAGVPYTVQGPDGPMHADFHALRHTYLTLGGRAGIDLRTLQKLAGHSTSTLTEKYTHVRLHDEAGAVERLPAFLPGQATEAEKSAAGNGRATEQKRRRKA